MRNFIFIVIFFCYFKIGYSQAGKLDVSFGDNGIVRTDFGSSTNIYGALGRNVLILPDHTMYLIFETNGQTVITHLLSNGSIDSSYGNNGYTQSVTFGSAAVLQSDGKIVLAGARYNTDGTLDTTFSGDGKPTTDFGFQSLATQSNGKIVVAGTDYSEPTAGFDFGLARYNTDGTLDTTFSKDGKQTTDFGADDRAYSVVIQSDGKIVVAGSSGYYDENELALARYNSDGTPDSTFSEDGMQITNLGISSFAISGAIQSDGKIVLAGDNFIARYNTEGTPDTTFSEDGKQTLNFGLSYAHSMAIQSDGKIVVAGKTDTYTDEGVLETNFALFRYNTDGTPDSTFSEDGIQSTDFASGNASGESVAIQSEGKIVVAGYTGEYENSRFAVARYNIDGSLDDTFSQDGKLTGYLPVGNTTYTGIAIQTDGRIVAVGTTFTETGSNFAIARHNTDGTLDTTFSQDGKAITDFNQRYDWAEAVAIQSDGKIVVAGSSDTLFAVARYNADGTLDKAFSADGKQTTDFAPGTDFAQSVAMQSDGKIVVAGYSGEYETFDFAVARYDTDGTLDVTFSGDGKLTTDFASRSDLAAAIAIQSDGKIVVTGQAYEGNNIDFALARYDIDGTLDTTFSEDGKLTTDFASGFAGTNALAIQSDGKIVVAGQKHTYTSDLGNQYHFAVARYNTNGTIDTTFSDDGKLTTDFETKSAGARTVATQSDGKIVVAGYSGTFRDFDFFTISRYNTDGSLDVTFSDDGKQVTDATPGNDVINSIAISGNKLYAVGYGQNPGNVGVVARYLLDNERENKPPTVNLTIPYNIVKYSASARIKLNALATDEDGTITKVQFYKGNTLLHTERMAPYGFLWIRVPEGNYTLTAKAFDNNGNVTTSNAINVLVVEENIPPVVSVVSPVDDTTYTSPATIHIIAKAKDPNDRISKVELYNGTTLLRTEYYYPYTYTWMNVQPGTYTLTAKAYDDKGLSATSEPVTVSVTNASIVSRPSAANNNTAINGALNVRLSPNPVKSTLQIYTKGLDFNKRSTISLISTSGIVVKTIQANALNKVIQLDVASLTSGVYTIKVESGNNIAYKEFVKL